MVCTRALTYGIRTLTPGYRVCRCANGDAHAASCLSLSGGTLGFEQRQCRAGVYWETLRRLHLSSIYWHVHRLDQHTSGSRHEEQPLKIRLRAATHGQLGRQSRKNSLQDRMSDFSGYHGYQLLDYFGMCDRGANRCLHLEPPAFEQLGHDPSLLGMCDQGANCSLHLEPPAFDQLGHDPSLLGMCDQGAKCSLHLEPPAFDQLTRGSAYSWVDPTPKGDATYISWESDYSVTKSGWKLCKA